MTDKQIRMLLRLTSEEARMLLDREEVTLYREMQDQMVGLVREYGVRLPLNCLQFLYYESGHIREFCLDSDTEFHFQQASSTPDLSQGNKPICS